MFMKKNLLLLHGALGSGQSWKQIIPLLADDFTVFCPDLPGHGSNDVPPTEGSPEQMVSFLKEYIEQNIAGDYVIAGYSMGGYIALKFATENPGHLKGIITIATKFDWDEAIAEKESSGLTEENLAPILHHLQAAHNNNFPGILDLTKSILLSIGRNPLTKQDLQKIGIPVLAALGDRDKMVTHHETVEFASYMPAGRTEILVNQPHLLQKMDERVIAGLIKKTFNG
jgi:pimeloyl-ACP methyl ester carboxylesterase